MRVCLIAVVLLALPAFGQRPGGMGGGMRGGGGMSRGGGSFGGIRSGGHFGGHSGYRGAPARGGFRNFGGNRFYGNRYGSGYYGGFPFFYGGYFSSIGYSGYGGYVGYYDYPPSYGYGYAAPAIYSTPIRTVMEPAPSVVINQYISQTPQPVQQTSAQTPREEEPALSESDAPTTGERIYLIAFRDGLIYACKEYSVSGGTLHFTTMKGEVKQAPLANVDREFSAQLNRERRIPFVLTAH